MQTDSNIEASKILNELKVMSSECESLSFLVNLSINKGFCGYFSFPEECPNCSCFDYCDYVLDTFKDEFLKARNE